MVRKSASRNSADLTVQMHVPFHIGSPCDRASVASTVIDALPSSSA